MADKSFFGRLQRLFSSNIIVRRVGSNELKVVDNDRLQSSGNLNVSRYIDRFTRLHGVKSQLSTYNNNYNYYSSKTELYTDYECLAGDTLIPTLKHGDIQIDQLAELYPNKDSKFYVYSYDHKTDSVKIGTAHSVRKTKTAQTYKITFDDGKELIATDNHPILCRNGEYTLVKDLKPGTRVMPFYRKDFYSEGYKHIYNFSQGGWNGWIPDGWNGWIPEHTLVATQFHRELNENEVVHHKDFNKTNNMPDNLHIMDKAEHSAYHRIITNKNKIWAPENYEKHCVAIKEGVRKFIDSTKGKLINAAKSINLSYQDLVNVGVEILKTNGTVTLKDISKKLNVKYPTALKRVRDKGLGVHELYNDIQQEVNHKVVSIELHEVLDVYDMTVDEYHNFATTICFVHNCMDGDAIINSALDVYADETVLKDEFGNILTVKSDDSRIQKILENLFFDVLNVEFNLWPWVRNMCKYGDCYLKLDIEENVGVTNVTPMSSYEMVREEGVNRDNPYLVQFSNFNFKGVKWENYEVAHFRLITDSNFLPYGKSILEGGRKVWKQLTLLEDAMIIHRIMRAPEKRIFKIDIGNIPPNEVDGYMQRIMTQMKKVPYVDDKTGEYNLKFNLQNMLEDYYLPVRGGESGTQIDTLSGMEFTGINDVEYLRNKLLAGLKIPKAFIGYDEGVSGKATLAAEDVRFARTIERIQRIVISELTKIAIVHLYAQGFQGVDMLNFEITMTSPSAIYEQEKITLWNSKVDLAKSIVEGKLMSLDWIYRHIFNFSDDQITVEKNKIIEDVKQLYRKGKIENDGEDPQNPVGKPKDEEEGGESNPFEETGEEETKETPKQGEEKGGEEKETTKEEGVKPKVPAGGWPGAGRPRESVKYGTNRYVAGRDPLGYEGYLNSRKKTSRMESTDLYGLSRMKSKKDIITEDTNTESGSFLDENNLLNTEL